MSGHHAARSPYNRGRAGIMEKNLQVFGQLGMLGAERRGSLGLIAGKREIAKIESRSNRAAHQGIRPGGAGCLPPAGGNDSDGALFAINRAETVADGWATVWRRHPEVQGRALIEVPDLV